MKKSLNYNEFPEHGHKEFLENRILDFLELSENQEELLKERIEKNKGLIRVFIHPYYEDDKNWKENPKRIKKLKSINSAIQRILSLSDEETPPVLFFEEQGKIPILKDKIKSLKSLQNKTYIVPTYPDSSEPKLTPKDFSPDKEKREPEESWKTVVDKLKAFRIKKILISGMELHIGRGDRVPKGELFGCVGWAADRLSKDFKVEFSNLVFPEDRKDAKQFQKD